MKHLSWELIQPFEKETKEEVWKSFQKYLTIFCITF